MIKYITILLFICSLTYGQNNQQVFKSPNKGDTVRYDPSNPPQVFKGGVVYLPNIDTVFYWDSLNYELNKLIDLTDNNNDFHLVSSNCVEQNFQSRTTRPSQCLVLDSTITINTASAFSISFKGSMYSTVGYVLLAGSSSTSYIRCDTNRILVRGSSSLMTFSNVRFNNDSSFQEITIVGNGSSVTVTNITLNQTQTINSTCGTYTVTNILSRNNSSESWIGKLLCVNFDNKHFYSFSEGGGRWFHDLIGGNHAYIYNTTPTTHGTNNVYHYNLQHGYSRFSNGTTIIYVPHKINGDTVTVGVKIDAGYVKIANCSSGNYHNGAETKIQAPLTLYQYDVNEFLFSDALTPKEKGYSDFVEDVNNEHKIMMDTSVPYRYTNLIILK